MTSSKDVFSLRKSGQLDDAYRIAIERMSASDNNEWDLRALSWCLIDLVKREANLNASPSLSKYAAELKDLNIPADEDLLLKQRDYALSLCSLEGKAIQNARNLSKSGQHEQAIVEFRQLQRNNPTDIEIATSLGWEIYKVSKNFLENGDQHTYQIKQLLNEYLQLPVEKPSNLHSRILWIASRLIGSANFSTFAFSRIWDLHYLTSEDWQSFRTTEGKVLPSLAEKVIQNAAKDALKGSNQGALEYILPYISEAQKKHPENIWLILYHAKLLLSLSRHEEALSYAISITKQKPKEYWLWELLGDISDASDPSLGLSCYCKALTCPTKEEFIGKVRFKIAQHLVNLQLFSEAKFEVEKILIEIDKNSRNVPKELSEMQSLAWFTETASSTSNEEFYHNNLAAAEDLLISDLPWIDACAGDLIQPNEHNKNLRRRIYVKLGEFPKELLEPESNFNGMNLSLGDPLKVKGEWSADKRFRILKIDSRRDSSSIWDIFENVVAVVDHVNQEKRLIHYIVNRMVDGVIPFSELPRPVKIGQSLSIRLARYHTKGGERYRTLSCTETDQKPSSDLIKTFEESISVSDVGFGFTDSNIFVPDSLISEAEVVDGDIVEGTAVLNYNKKKAAWGFAAIKLKKRQQ